MNHGKENKVWDSGSHQLLNGCQACHLLLMLDVSLYALNGK